MRRALIASAAPACWRCGAVPLLAALLAGCMLGPRLPRPAGHAGANSARERARRRATGGRHGLVAAVRRSAARCADRRRPARQPGPGCRRGARRAVLRRAGHHPRALFPQVGAQAARQPHPRQRADHQPAPTINPTTRRRPACSQAGRSTSSGDPAAHRGGDGRAAGAARPSAAARCCRSWRRSRPATSPARPGPRARGGKRDTAPAQGCATLFEKRYRGGVVSEVEVARRDPNTPPRCAPYRRSTGDTQQENALSMLLGRNPGPIARGRSATRRRRWCRRACPPTAGAPARYPAGRAGADRGQCAHRCGQGRVFPEHLAHRARQASRCCRTCGRPRGVWTYGGTSACRSSRAGAIAGQVQSAEARSARRWRNTARRCRRRSAKPRTRWSACKSARGARRPQMQVGALASYAWLCAQALRRRLHQLPRGARCRAQPVHRRLQLLAIAGDVLLQPWRSTSRWVADGSRWRTRKRRNPMCASASAQRSFRDRSGPHAPHHHGGVEALVGSRFAVPTAGDGRRQRRVARHADADQLAACP